MSINFEKNRKIEDVNFLDLFDLESIQKLQDVFAYATSVASIITYPDGTPITKPSNFCRLCNDIIRKTEKGLKNCYYSDAQLGRQNPDGPIYQKCLSGGLWDGGAGISVGSKHIANWLIGQIRNEDVNEDKMMLYAREIGADEEEFRKALNEVEKMSVDKFKKITDALFLFANQLSNQAYQNLQLRLYQNHLEMLVKEKTEDLEAINEELKATNDELNEKNSIINQKNIELVSALEDLKSTQLQLLESEKMASLGILTAGVAHEINNPLNYIMGAYVGLDNFFNKDLPQHKEHVSILLKSIHTGIERVSNIVQSLNQFSRDNVNLNESCDINKIIENCLVMLYNQYKCSIQIINKPDPENPMIKGNVGKIHQVFINVLTNAIQAIDCKGTITIETSLKENGVEIQIIDTGAGIDKTHLSKITDPFFTTKPPGKGTGLGLYITYKIIKEHKGKLEFHSELQKGTTVKITLPLN